MDPVPTFNWVFENHPIATETLTHPRQSINLHIMPSILQLSASLLIPYALPESMVCISCQNCPAITPLGQALNSHSLPRVQHTSHAVELIELAPEKNHQLRLFAIIFNSLK